MRPVLTQWIRRWVERSACLNAVGKREILYFGPQIESRFLDPTARSLVATPKVLYRRVILKCILKIVELEFYIWTKSKLVGGLVLKEDKSETKHQANE
jgi:hypothetical protein